MRSALRNGDSNNGAEAEGNLRWSADKSEFPAFVLSVTTYFFGISFVLISFYLIF